MKRDNHENISWYFFETGPVRVRDIVSFAPGKPEASQIHYSPVFSLT